MGLLPCEGKWSWSNTELNRRVELHLQRVETSTRTLGKYCVTADVGSVLGEETGWAPRLPGADGLGRRSDITEEGVFNAMAADIGERRAPGETATAACTRAAKFHAFRL